MKKVAFAVATGFLVGIAAAFVVLRDQAPDLPFVETAAELPTASAERPPSATPRSLSEIARLAGDFEQTAALYQLLRRADAATLDRLLVEADALDAARDVRAKKSIILARYAELDPAAAVTAAMATAGSDDALVRAVFAAWGKYDHAAALDHARGLPEPQRRYAAVATLGAAAGLDADEKLEVAESFSVLETFVRMQAQESALDDPVAAWRDAIATYGQSPDETGREALWRIAQRWADSDPRSAVAAVAALPASTQRRSWLSSLVQHWARLDLASASVWAEALSPSAERSRLLADVVGVIAADTPQEAIAFAETLGGEAGQQAIGAALNAWADEDPQAALAALDGLGNHPMRQYWQRQIAGRWASQDARAAWDWAVTQSPSPSRSSLLWTPLRAIAQTDPLEAVTLAGRLRGRERRTGMDMALRTWASNDVRAAANWAARTDNEPRERDQQLGTVLDTWARDDPLAAMAWVEASDLSSGAAVSAVARHYATRSPRQAMDWVLSQPLGVQRRAITGVVRSWARDAPQAASRAVARIREAEVRALGREALASTWGETDPSRALRWVAGLADADTRTDLATRVLQRWASYDAEAAVTHVRRMRDDHQRDAMAVALTQGGMLAYNDPPLAEELYESIADPEARRSAATMLYAIFQNRDPERAERYREAIRP